MAAYVCAEDFGGCGTVWTPSSDRRPVLNAPAVWCPDCILLGRPEEVATS